MNVQTASVFKKLTAIFASLILTFSVAAILSGCSGNDDRSTDEKFIEADERCDQLL